MRDFIRLFICSCTRLSLSLLSLLSPLSLPLTLYYGKKKRERERERKRKKKENRKKRREKVEKRVKTRRPTNQSYPNPSRYTQVPSLTFPTPSLPSFPVNVSLHVNAMHANIVPYSVRWPNSPTSSSHITFVYKPHNNLAGWVRLKYLFQRYV